MDEQGDESWEPATKRARFAKLGVHDNHYGNVSCISLTYDDQYLLTGAGDGNVFIYKTNLPANSPTSAPVKVSIVCVNFVVPFFFIYM